MKKVTSPIEHELERLASATRAAKQVQKKQKTWAVYVETFKWGRRVTYKTFFRVGVQYFTLAETDDRKEGKRHCQFVAKMFLLALGNMKGRRRVRK